MLEKFAKVYVQKYKKKYRVTFEVDIKIAYKIKGFYKLFRLYQRTWEELDKQGNLISKSTVQYCDKHILQLQIKSIDDNYKLFSEITKLGCADIIFL